MIECFTPSPDARHLTVSWEGGGESSLSAEMLRREAQDAWSKRERIVRGEVTVPEGIFITHIAQVGLYGVNLHFSDGHDLAIYPFVHLRELSDRFDKCSLQSHAAVRRKLPVKPYDGSRNMDDILDGLTQIDCDILATGGGTAGPMAALKARKASPDANVVLLDKANVKRSGAISMGMDGLNNSVIPGYATPEQHTKEITLANDGICDQAAVYRYAEECYGII